MGHPKEAVTYGEARGGGELDAVTPGRRAAHGRVGFGGGGSGRERGGWGETRQEYGEIVVRGPCYLSVRGGCCFEYSNILEGALWEKTPARSSTCVGNKRMGIPRRGGAIGGEAKNDHGRSIPPLTASYLRLSYSLGFWTYRY